MYYIYDLLKIEKKVHTINPVSTRTCDRKINPSFLFTTSKCLWRYKQLFFCLYNKLQFCGYAVIPKWKFRVQASWNIFHFSIRSTYITFPRNCETKKWRILTRPADTINGYYGISIQIIQFFKASAAVFFEPWCRYRSAGVFAATIWICWAALNLGRGWMPGGMSFRQQTCSSGSHL